MANDYIVEVPFRPYEIIEAEKEKLLSVGMICAGENPGAYQFTAYVWDDLGFEGTEAYDMLDFLLRRKERWNAGNLQ